MRTAKGKMMKSGESASVRNADGIDVSPSLLITRIFCSQIIPGQEDEDLSDEDRELMAENMGIRSTGHKLTRVRRGRVGSDSASPEPTSARRTGRDSDEGDDVTDLHRIFDDERGGDDMEVDDEDDFIDDEGEEGEVDEEERRERRRVERERRRAFGAKPEMAGIDPA